MIPTATKAGDCDDVTCPDGWNSDETILMPIQINSTDYCLGKICYCYDLDTLVESPQFRIEKVIWVDSACYETHFHTVGTHGIDWSYIKKSAVTEFIKEHSQELPQPICPNYWITTLLWTSYCMIDQQWSDGYIYSVRCDGEGYCIHDYTYCWDLTHQPPVLTVIPNSIVQSWPSNCSVPFLPPSVDWHYISDCYSICDDNDY